MGSALAIQNAIGFAITTVAIALAYMLPAMGASVVWSLAPGPVLRLVGLWRLVRKGT